MKTHSPAETRVLGEMLAQKLRPGDVLLFGATWAQAKAR